MHKLPRKLGAKLLHTTAQAKQHKLLKLLHTHSPHTPLREGTPFPLGGVRACSSLNVKEHHA